MTPSTPQAPVFSSFWTLQGIGWGMYGILWYLASLPVYGSFDTPFVVAGIRVLYYVALGLGITLVFRPLYRRLWAQGASLSTLIGAAIGCSLVGSGVWLMCFEAIKWPLDLPSFSGAYGASSLLYFARPLVSTTFVLLAWSALYFGTKYQRDLLAQQERLLRAETLARDAQLQMLRYQLNPHFLFNTLNTLLSLIGEDDRRAKQFVHELAGLLRYSLLDTEATTVSLHEEMEIIRSFLSIEKLRFGDDLLVEWNVDPATTSVQVPPFVVQALVENAVKHGQESSGRPLQVRLAITLHAGTLQVEVANTGHLRSESWPSRHSTPGIGLKNVRERLDKLYPNRHTFSLKEIDGWVRARLCLPSAVSRPAHGPTEKTEPPLDRSVVEPTR